MIPNIFVLLGVGAIIIFLILHFRKKDIREGAKLRAYNFGFPTSGSYNNGGGPLRGGWPNSRWPNRGSRGRRRRRYYRNYIKPYLTGTCYSSSMEEDCLLGYSKTRKDSDGDGWLCCRDRDMF